MYQCRAKTRVGKIRQECTPEFFRSCTESRAQQGVDDSSDLVVVLPDRPEPFFRRIPGDALETVSSDSDTVQFLKKLEICVAIGLVHSFLNRWLSTVTPLILR